MENALALRPRYVDAALATVGIVLLFAHLASIRDYSVTVGALVIGPVMLLTALRPFRNDVRVIAIAAFFIAWPFLPALLAWLFNAELAPEIPNFMATGTLWAISVGVIAASVLSRQPVLAHGAFYVNIAILALSLAQAIGGRYLNNFTAYEIVQPIIKMDLFRSYLNVLLNPRAIGTYYEPSMCGRVMATLCFIDVLLNRKLLRSLLILGLGVFATKSLGMLALAAAMGAVLLGRSAKEIGILGLMLLSVVGLQQALFAERTSARSLEDGSNNARIIAPLSVIEYAVTNYPLGVPLGSNRDLAIVSGYVQQTGEPQVSNGTYQFLIGFGVMGFGLMALALFFTAKFWLESEREYALVLLYLSLSTATSGTPYSLESALLTYFLVGACITARSRRRAAEYFQRRRTSVPEQRRQSVLSPAAVHR